MAALVVVATRAVIASAAAVLAASARVALALLRVALVVTAPVVVAAVVAARVVLVARLVRVVVAAWFSAWWVCVSPSLWASTVVAALSLARRRAATTAPSTRWLQELRCVSFFAT
jgi:hypothetical protein